MTRPWLRRALHAATAAILLFVPLLSASGFRLLVGGLAFAVAVADVARLLEPRYHAALARRIPVFRTGEAQRPSGALWLWLGYFVATFFPAPASCAGILVAALADPIAGSVGARFSRPGRKSWQGSLAALVVAAVVLIALRLPGPAIAGGSVVGALLERWPGPFDDNLLIAPGVAAAVMLLG